MLSRSERRRKVEIVLVFALGVVFVSLGSFLWLPLPLSNEVRNLGQGMYWFGFAALANGVFLVVKHLKLVIPLFLALGIVLSFLGLVWSDTFQTEIYNPLTLAALGIFFAIASTIIEWWFGEHQANA